MIGCLENFLAALEVKFSSKTWGFGQRSTASEMALDEVFSRFFYISCDIFCSVRRVTVIFLPLERATFVQPSTYLQHHDRMPRKFLSERTLGRYLFGEQPDV